jgi:flagellar protein FlaG
MNNHINSAPSNADNGFILKPAANLDYTKEDKVSLSIEKQAEADNTVANLAEQIQAENKIKKQREKNISEDDINKALEVVSSFMNNSNKQVSFSNDNSSGKTVITITDKKTNEVINQFPNEKIILMAERIQDLHREAESITGLLIDSRV